MATLVLENVSKFFPGNVCAVEDLSLSAADGELLVLFGPSGCGKTTTLRMIAGLEEVTRGSISIDGRAVNRVAAKDRNVAMVFQNFALYPHWSVYGNMAFGLKMRRVSKAETNRRVCEAADLLHIDGLLGRRPAELSGGERQRVALGRAIVRRPKVFLFDEPLSNLDAPLRNEMRREIGRLHQRLATTMICVTHDQVEAMTLGHRIAVLRAGRLQQLANPPTLYQRPANRFVAGTIGSPAMSFLDGRIERAEEKLLFCGDGFDLPVAEGKQSALQSYIGRAVVAGMRPEHVSSVESGTSRVRAIVETVEAAGPDSYAYLKIGRQDLIARLEAGRTISSGEAVDVAVAIDRIHFFDAQTENAIT